MKKQDILTPIGLLLGIGFVFYGISLGDVSIKAFLSPSSLAITLGGSFAAVLVTFSVEEIKHVIKMTYKAFTQNDTSRIELMEDLKSLSRQAKREGVLSLEDNLEDIEDEFLHKALELVIDDVEEATIRSILTIKAKEEERRFINAAKVYKTWGAYAPAFGMIGTLIGLIQMLADLQSPDVIASGMANALITTFYGALLANIVLIPLGSNIQTKSQSELIYREMIIVGILSIKDGDSINVMQDRLLVFLNEKEIKQYNKQIEYSKGAELSA